MEIYKGEQYEDFEDYEVAEPGDSIEVSYPGKAITRGISTCHAVGILNTKNGKGYLGHFFNGTTDAKDLLEEAISKSGDVEDLKVVLAGNVPLTRNDLNFTGGNFDETLADYHKHAAWLSDLLKEKGINPNKVKNFLDGNPSDISYEMKLDTKKKEIIVRREEPDEYF